MKASTDSTTDLAKKNRGSVQSITKVGEGELKGKRLQFRYRQLETSAAL